MQTSREPPRASSLEILGCAEECQSGSPSGPRLRGEGVAVSRRGSSAINPTDWTTVSILSNRLNTCLKLNPDGGRDKCGKYWRRYRLQSNQVEDVCLTCGARARSVVTVEVGRT